MTIEKTILDRAGFMADDPALKPAFAAITRALDTHMKFRTKAAEVAKDSHRTPLGKQDVLRKFVGENAHEVLRVRKSVDVMRTKVADRRKSLLPATADPTDASLAVMKSAMCARILGMKAGERAQLLLSPNADTRLLAAVVEYPNFMSGMDDQIRELVTAAVIERTHPGALAQLEKADEAIELVEVAARVAFSTARDAAEFPSDAVFAKFVEESVGDSRVLEADVERSFAPMADAA